MEEIRGRVPLHIDHYNNLNQSNVVNPTKNYKDLMARVDQYEPNNFAYT